MEQQGADLSECQRDAALTGHVFKLIHCGENRRLTVLQEEDDQQCQSIVVEKGTGTAGITYMSQRRMCVHERMIPYLQQDPGRVYTGCSHRMKALTSAWGFYSMSLVLSLPKGKCQFYVQPKNQTKTKNIYTVTAL